MEALAIRSQAAMCSNDKVSMETQAEPWQCQPHTLTNTKRPLERMASYKISKEQIDA